MQVVPAGVAGASDVADHQAGLDLTLGAVGPQVGTEVVVAVGGDQVEGAAADGVPAEGDRARLRGDHRGTGTGDDVDAVVLPAARAGLAPGVAVGHLAVHRADPVVVRHLANHRGRATTGVGLVLEAVAVAVVQAGEDGGVLVAQFVRTRDLLGNEEVGLGHGLGRRVHAESVAREDFAGGGDAVLDDGEAVGDGLQGAPCGGTGRGAGDSRNGREGEQKRHRGGGEPGHRFRLAD